MMNGLKVGALLLAVMPLTTAAQQRVTLPERDRQLTVTPQNLFAVGRAEGNSYETFANVFEVTFDAAGNLYVLDTGNHRVVVFDRSGKHLRTIGRRGGGPGELMAPLGIVVSPAGELIINDAAKNGLQVFKVTGEFLRTVPWENGQRVFSRIALHAAGGVLGESEVFDFESRGLPTRSAPRAVALMPFAGGAMKRLYEAPPLDLTQTEGASSGGSQMFAVRPPMFAPRLHWASLPGGLVAASHTDRYRITVVDANGKAVRVLERPIEPRKVTEADRKKAVEDQKNSQGVFIPAPGSRGHAPADRRPPPITSFATHMPVVQQMIADLDGRLWIHRGDRSLPGPIDLVTASGSYLGTLPPQAFPDAFGPDGLVAYIGTDDDGAPRVTVRRIQLPAAG